MVTLTGPVSGRTRTLRYDPLGRTTEVAIGSLLAPLRMGYDAHGRLTHLVRGSRAWRYGYDDHGRLASVTDTLARQTTYAYDAADRETLQTLPGGRTVRYRWDANGNLLGLTPPGREEHGFAYTEADLNQTYTPPGIPGVADPASRYEFNKDRQLTQVTRPDGAVVQLHYDTDTGQLQWLSQPRGSTQFHHAGSTGQLTGTTSPDAVVSTYAYDGPLLMRESWSGAASGEVAHAVNDRFLEERQTVVAGTDSSSAVTYGYDADGLLTSATIGTVTETIHRRADDGLIDWTTAGGVRSDYAYNEHGELALLSYTFGGDTLFRQAIDRDALGRIVGINERWSGGAAVPHVFHYDVAGRLDSVAVAGVHVAGYTYDENGNRTAWRGYDLADTLTATIDAQDRLMRYGNTRYEYTDAGELQRRIVPVPPGQQGQNGGIPYTADTTTYTYDALGNLLRVATWSDTVAYLIDGANRRVGRIENGVRTHTWLYRDGLGVIAELDGSGSLKNRYVYGTLGHVPDLVVRDGVTYRLITDQLGSVRAVVKVDSGAVVQRIDYDAWGVRTLDTAPGWQSLGFAGGLTDSTTALVRFGARDYDAGVGRWTSKDPIGRTTASVGLYAYVSNNPIASPDPSGLYQWHGAWGGPDWTNDGERWRETGHFPHLPGQAGYVPAIDARDELYREHDVDLMHCARIADPEARKRCRREADFDLFVKMARFGIDHPGDDWWCRYVEMLIFMTPWSPNSRSD